ncbi:MAG: F0F1 ATP synthase subunit alpha, partial [Firmicutes bacterium]|nr:F0F1 ATP synthase subunit alpha [Bacillota bacterium]
YLADVEVVDVKDFEKALYEYMDSLYPQVGRSIAETGEIADDIEDTLKDAIEDCKKEFFRGR